MPLQFLCFHQVVRFVFNFPCALWLCLALFMFLLLPSFHHSTIPGVLPGCCQPPHSAPMWTFGHFQIATTGATVGMDDGCYNRGCRAVPEQVFEVHFPKHCYYGRPFLMPALFKTSDYMINSAPLTNTERFILSCCATANALHRIFALTNLQISFRIPNQKESLGASYSQPLLAVPTW